MPCQFFSSFLTFLFRSSSLPLLTRVCFAVFFAVCLLSSVYDCSNGYVRVCSWRVFIWAAPNAIRRHTYTRPIEKSFEHIRTVGTIDVDYCFVAWQHPNIIVIHLPTLRVCWATSSGNWMWCRRTLWPVSYYCGNSRNSNDKLSCDRWGLAIQQNWKRAWKSLNVPPTNRREWINFSYSIITTLNSDGIYSTIRRLLIHVSRICRRKTERTSS